MPVTAKGLSERAMLFPSRACAAVLRRRPDGASPGVRCGSPEWVTVDDLTSEISGLRTGRPRAAHHRTLQSLFGIPRRAVRQVLFLGRHAPHGFRHDRQIPDRRRRCSSATSRRSRRSKPTFRTSLPRSCKSCRFWSTLADETDLSEEKRRFLAIWKTLGPVYARFRERLSVAGHRLQRHGPAGRRRPHPRRGGIAFPEARRYVVAGFNALSECEKQLFRFLSTAAETDFYWDYDSYYKDRPEQEAGMFVRENVVQFPPRGDVSHDNMRASEGADRRGRRVERRAVQARRRDPAGTGRTGAAGQAHRRGADR